MAAYLEDELLETALTREQVLAARGLQLASVAAAPLVSEVHTHPAPADPTVRTAEATTTAVGASLCPECGTSPLRPGQVVCSLPCRQRRRARQERERRARALGKPAVAPVLSEVAVNGNGTHNGSEAHTEAPADLATAATNGASEIRASSQPFTEAPALSQQDLPSEITASSQPFARAATQLDGSALHSIDLVGLVASLAHAGLLVRVQGLDGVSLEVTECR